MPQIQPLEPEHAPEQARQLMEQMLNFFKQFADSPASFQAYMDFNTTLQGGAFDR